MNSTNFIKSWSKMLCCIKCKEIFTKDRVPINLACGHLMCDGCTKLDDVSCPFDKIEIGATSKFHYINGPVLSILLGQDDLKSIKEIQKNNLEGPKQIQDQLYRLAEFLHKVDSERGATISSNRISRTTQRKLMSILCTNILANDGRKQIILILRSMLERVVSEMILHLSTGSNLSTSLWNAVRARGCQFLGPALQEDVLKIIHCAMFKGDSIERKALVMRIVQKLERNYSHISKTASGHVVQLLYRASCFNVIKREDQSSLMVMKEEFRNYDALRAEHDAQIVQIAMDAGLRISPDQWSNLLYGDPKHRAHMQSICDRLGDHSFSKAIDELRKLVDQSTERNLFGIPAAFNDFEALVTKGIETLDTDLDWEEMESYLDHANSILAIYSAFFKDRNAERELQHQYQHQIGNYENSTSKQRYTGRDHYTRPLREHNARNALVPQYPPGMGFDNRPMPLMAYNPAPQAQHSSSLADYLFETSLPMPIGSPPNFIAPPLSFSPPNYQMITSRDSLVGSSHDSYESVPTTVMTMLPLSPQRSTSPHIPVSTSPTMFNGGPSIIFLGNTSPSECTTIANPIIGPNQPITGTTILSTSPPAYQLSPGGLISTPATAFSIPVQPSQSLIVYESSPGISYPFGSPPLLFPQWVTPMDNATIQTGFGLNFINNSANVSEQSSYRDGPFGENSYEGSSDNSDSKNQSKERCNSTSDSHNHNNDGAADNHE